MRALRTTKRFKRDLKLAQRRGLDLDRLWAIVEALLRGEKLAPRHRAHRLSGDWERFLECHVAPDWLLIWDDDGKTVTLVRTGTHSDLFE
jgi:mRNA interferase YafQ